MNSCADHSAGNPGITQSNKLLARCLAEAFQSRTQVSRYWDDNQVSSVDIMASENSPQRNVTSYSTIGLSDHPLMRNGVDTGLRTELVGACGAAFGDYPNILATAAFNIINSGWYCEPGIVFPDVAAMYRKNGNLAHVLFITPFLWDRLETENLSDKTVAWLQVVPISEEECRYSEKHGSSALEGLFEKAKIDVFNLDRHSVV